MSFDNILSNQLKELSSLKLEDRSSLELIDYHANSIFRTLLYTHELERKTKKKTSFNLTEVGKLAEFCVKLLNLSESDDWHDVWWQCELSAIRILILIAKLPDLKDIDQQVIQMIYNALVTKIKLQECENYSFAEHRTMMLAGLSAYCLSLINLDKILSPDEASDLIGSLALPLAIQGLNDVSVYKKKSLYKYFQADFHGLLDCQDQVFTQDSIQDYPLVIRFLLALSKHSDSGSRGYRKQFEQILETASESSEIMAEVIVALNVIVAYHFSDRSKGGLEAAENLLIDFLTKTEDHYRAHIAQLMRICFEYNNKSDKVGIFGVVMFDTLITTNHKLLDKMAIESIYSLRNRIQNWDDIVQGKEIELITKLIDTNAKPWVYHMFLRRFKHLNDSRLSEYENLSLIPISKTLNELHYQLKSKYGVSTDCLTALDDFLRLRKHRLDQSYETRLNEALELILKSKRYRSFHSWYSGHLLVLVNSYQVHPIAWRSLIDLIRSIDDSTQDHADLECCEQIINLALPNLLIRDADNFYSRIGSLDVLELIYRYCKRVAESHYVETPLKEILLTWPKYFKTTLLDSSEHSRMLYKFIELLTDQLVGIEKITARRRTSVVYIETSELLFGLVAAFSIHRDALFSVLDSLKSQRKLANRDLWLRNNILIWSKAIVENGTRQSSDGEPIVPLDKFANVIIACKAFKKINRESQAYFELVHRFNTSSIVSSETMLKVIDQALDRGLDRAPANSLESNMYQKFKVSLSAWNLTRSEKRPSEASETRHRKIRRTTFSPSILFSDGTSVFDARCSLA